MKHLSYDSYLAIRAELEGKLDHVPVGERVCIDAFLVAVAELELFYGDIDAAEIESRLLDIEEKRQALLWEVPLLVEQGRLPVAVLAAARQPMVAALPASPAVTMASVAIDVGTAIAVCVSKVMGTLREQGTDDENALVKVFDEAHNQYNASHHDPSMEARQGAERAWMDATRALLPAIARRDPEFYATLSGHVPGPTSPTGVAVPPAPAPPPSAPPIPSCLGKRRFRTDVLDPRKLGQYWRNNEIFPLASENDARFRELVQDVRDHGITRPLVVTGENCASAPGTVLGGHRRRRAAIDANLREVPVVVHDGLTADEEYEIFLRDNLADLHGRKLSPKQKADLEKRLAGLHTVGKGRRTDLKTSVKNNQGDGAPASAPGGPQTTRAKVAAEVGDSPSTITARQTCFFSPLSTEALREAVDARKLKENPAAAIIRSVQREPGIREAVKAYEAGTVTATDQAKLEEAQRRVDEELAKRLATPRKKKTPKADAAAAETESSKPLPAGGDAPPAGAPPIFQDRPELEEGLRHLKASHALFVSVANGWAKGPGRDIAKAAPAMVAIVKQLGVMIEQVRDTLIPREVCAACDAESEECAVCGGTGWLSRTPQETVRRGGSKE
ncbi:ParB/RepB/Spo0J family partition protein [Polyangium fumosum]|uniref:ParB-like N-terminal domain-containing protein n=1 Tax=Polyangium fumosum TaxID=889272 RepID=A0A4U1I954_9BACT|nr:ParB N-terminal domain-containing protein [Polyangium fumosum]TKC90014.1 hypothetical protein E8A74_51230 [Polyangium fumosum]